MIWRDFSGRLLTNTAMKSTKMSDCPDLKKLAGKRYKTSYDPAAKLEPQGKKDPWLVVIPCLHGEIYPHSHDRLAFSSKIRGGAAMAISRLRGARVEQDGQDGMNISFPVGMFEEVAQLARARKRRVMSPEHRAAMIASGAFFAKKQRSDAPKTGQNQDLAPESTQNTPGFAIDAKACQDEACVDGGSVT